MVAVEGGKGGPDGPVWNELPDRFADIFVLVGAGYGVAWLGIADASLGWAAAVAAVMTAYVREVARSAGAPADFSGPMAKPHRMFVMTTAALLAATAPLWARADSVIASQIIHFALWIVLIGSVFTTLNRTRRALVALRTPKP
jgi:phosphatidylglycerophosphate synthase